MEIEQRLLELEANGERPNRRRWRGYTEYEITLAMLTESVYANIEADISILELETALDQRITQTVEDGGELCDFIQKKNQYLGEIHGREDVLFQFYFPLNIRTPSDSTPPNRISFKDFEAVKVPEGELVDQYNKVGWISKEETKLDRLSTSKIEFRPNRANTLPGYRVDIHAPMKDAAMHTFEARIDTALGVLNYIRFKSRNFRLPSTEKEGNGLPQPVTGPPFVLVKDPEGKIEEIRRREKPAYPARVGRSAERRLGEFPDFSTESPLDTAIQPGLQAYQDALTAPGKEAALLALWRGLESATFTENGESSDTSVKRAISFQQDIPREVLEKWVEDHLRQKRNDIAHKTERRPILTRDIRLLEFLLLSMIEALTTFRRQGRGQEIQGIMEHDVDSDTTLQEKLEEHEEAVEKLRAALDWRDW